MRSNRLTASHHSFYLRMLLPVAVLLLLAGSGEAAPPAQSAIGEAVRAVVRILPQHCTPAGCQDAGVGSGAIIDPSGVILTAWHVAVVDEHDLLSPTYWDDFVIEMSADARSPARPRYRAQLIAARPEVDLALLRIYRDEGTKQLIRPGALVDLPVLPMADAASVSLGEPLHILGYPVAGRQNIDYTETTLGGFEEEGALLRVRSSLSEGNSGGPALVEHAGSLEIVGVVVRARGSRGELGILRSVDQLQGLTWQPSAQRAWAENVQATARGAGDDGELRLDVDLHALDFVKRPGRVLAYVFDAGSGQPWRKGTSAVDRTTGGQAVLRRDFSGTAFVEQQRETLSVALADLDAAPDELLLRVLVWDAAEARVLWQGDDWLRPSVAVAAAETATPTPTGIPTAVPPTSMPTATETPRPTETPTQPLPTATSAPRPTATPTPQPPTATPTATPSLTPAEPAAGATRQIGGITFVYVPAGEFSMGSSEAEIDAALELCQQYSDSCQRSWFEVESPQHTVYVDGFWIGQTEVTNAQYQAFVDAGGYETKSYWSEAGWSWRMESNVTEPAYWEDENFNGADQPVVGISWYEATAYANWLAAKTGQTMRLPSEAEWEKAARGTDGRTFPWGDAWDPARANYCDKNCGEAFELATWADMENNDGYALTAPVGSYPDGASPYGVLDMAGNAWEWVQDWYAGDYYASSPRRNPGGPPDGTSRVWRGGSWYDDPVDVRSAYRDWNHPPPFDRHLNVGMRVVAPGF